MGPFFPSQTQFIFLSLECYITATKKNEATAGKDIRTQTKSTGANNMLDNGQMKRLDATAAVKAGAERTLLPFQSF